jgi:hypothetical protein
LLQSQLHQLKKSDKTFTWLLAAKKEVYLKPSQLCNASKSNKECVSLIAIIIIVLEFLARSTTSTGIYN